MNEIPIYFNNSDHRLFGILHSPGNPNGCGYVFCHPFAEEKLWAHRVYVNYARNLADMGYYILRFDYMGHGDSSGNFEDTDADTRIADINAAVCLLSEKIAEPCRIGLIGLRFGGTLAVLAAEQNHKISSIVLWEPVDKGAQYMKELLRINLTTQTAVYKEIRHNTKSLVDRLRDGYTVNIDGYEIKRPLYDQIVGIHLSEQRIAFKGPVLIVQMNRREGMGTKRINDISAKFTNITMTSVVEQPFWKEIKQYYTRADQLFDVTTKWILKHG